MSSTVVDAKGMEPPFYTPIFKNGSRIVSDIALGPRRRRTNVVGGLATAAILPRPDLYGDKVYEPRPAQTVPLRPAFTQLRLVYRILYTTRLGFRRTKADAGRNRQGWASSW